MTLGAAVLLPGSTATARSFNGTSSSVHLPANLIAASSYQTISLWFKTSTPNGVIFSYSNDPITNGTTSGYWTSALYVGSSGRLYGELYVR